MIKRNSYIWNAIYSIVNALQSAILLVAVSRTSDLDTAGIITFAFALAGPVMLIARFGIRNFQVTDVREQYSFSDYFYCRIVSTGGALTAALIYLLIMVISRQYTFYKGVVILEVVLLKLVDAFEGVYIGRLQQQGRLDIGARIGAIRLLLSTLIMFLLLFLIPSVPLCLFTGLIVSLAADVILIRKSRGQTTYPIKKPDPEPLKQLLLTGISLCLGTVLHNIAGNAPKYLVELYLNDEIQAISGYVMMPVFVITVLNLFLMHPLVKDIGDAWENRDIRRFRQMILRHVLIISLMAVLVAVLGLTIGLPILSWLYKTDLNPFRLPFICYLIGGVFYTLSEYFMVPLVAVRKQNVIVAGTLAALLINAGMGIWLLPGMGMTGTALIYIFANLAMLLVFVTVLIRKIRDSVKSC